MIEKNSEKGLNKAKAKANECRSSERTSIAKGSQPLPSPERKEGKVIAKSDDFASSPSEMKL